MPEPENTDLEHLRLRGGNPGSEGGDGERLEKPERRES